MSNAPAPDLASHGPAGETMKPRVLAVVPLFLVSMCVSTFAKAATRDWRYNLNGGLILELVADDVGGVAFVYATSDATRLVWLDSKGRVTYQKQLTGANV